MTDEPHPTEPLGNDPALRGQTGTLLESPPTKTEPEPKAEPEAKAETKSEGAPEKYEAFTVPEGYELDAKVSESAGELFREIGLSQEQAQKLVDFYSKQALDSADAPYKKFEEIRTGWRNEVLSDPALGNGTELKAEVKATVGRAIDSMGAKEAAAFREAMELTGAADNPAVFRGLYALAKQATEGRPVKAGGPVAPEKPKGGAAALYPNLPTAS